MTRAADRTSPFLRARSGGALLRLAELVAMPIAVHVGQLFVFHGSSHLSPSPAKCPRISKWRKASVVPERSAGFSTASGSNARGGEGNSYQNQRPRRRVRAQAVGRGRASRGIRASS